MKLETAETIQFLIAEKLEQLNSDIRAYQTTFKDAPGASEIVASLTHRCEELLDAKTDFETVQCTVGMLTRKSQGVICRLAEDLRKEVEQMITSGRYSYAEIVSFLAKHGTKISTTSVWRYAQNLRT